MGLLYIVRATQLFNFNLMIECHQNPNISRTLVGSKIVDHLDLFVASPVGAARTISSFSI